MSSFSTEYHPLTPSGDGESGKSSLLSLNALTFEGQLSTSSRKRYLPWILHGSLASLWLLATFVTLVNNRHQHCPQTEFYSPALPAVEYEDRTFTSNIWTKGPSTPKTIYSGPLSDENNAAWHHLTRAGMMKFPASEEAKLPNRTTAFLKEPGMHFGNVEMFHSLHCVDILRKEAFRNDTERAANPMLFYHLDHCVEYLRQSAMCEGNLNIMPFWLNETSGEYHPQFDGLHRCRKFEPIYDYVMDRQAGNMITA